MEVLFDFSYTGCFKTLRTCLAH